MKKGQSLLVFFGVQLICIMLFFIVLLSLLTMTRSVSFRIQQFDEHTNHMLVTRWLLSSSDCLAYESRSILLNERGLNFLSRVHPYIIDVNKVRDFQHINCIRMDDYDLQIDALNEVYDAKNGSGIGLKYDVIVFDLSGDEPMVLTGPNAEFSPIEFDPDVDVEDYATTSLLGRVYKQPQEWFRDERIKRTCNVENIGWEEYTIKKIIDCENSESHFCEECLDFSIDYSQFKYYWTKGRPPSVPSAKYRGEYVFGHPERASGHHQHWSAIIMDFNETEDGREMILSIWHHQNMTCFGEPNIMRKFFPVTLYDNGEFKYGAVFIQTCLLEGDNYRGMTLPEFEFKGKLRG